MWTISKPKRDFNEIGLVWFCNSPRQVVLKSRVSRTIERHLRLILHITRTRSNWPKFATKPELGEKTETEWERRLASEMWIERVAEFPISLIRISGYSTSASEQRGRPGADCSCNGNRHKAMGKAWERGACRHVTRIASGRSCHCYNILYIHPPHE